MPSRRFPPPWSIEEGSACFIVCDGDKQALAYVYYENEPGRRSSAKLLTRDEALAILQRLHATKPKRIAQLKANHQCTAGFEKIAAPVAALRVFFCGAMHLPCHEARARHRLIKLPREGARLAGLRNR